MKNFCNLNLGDSIYILHLMKKSEGISIYEYRVTGKYVIGKSIQYKAAYSGPIISENDRHIGLNKILTITVNNGNPIRRMIIKTPDNKDTYTLATELSGIFEAIDNS